MVLISVAHITAGVYINDAEEGIIRDIDNKLVRLVGPDYHYHRTGEGMETVP